MCKTNVSGSTINPLTKLHITATLLSIYLLHRNIMLLIVGWIFITTDIVWT